MKNHNYISDHSEPHWFQHVILVTVRPFHKESTVEDHQSVKCKNGGLDEFRRCEHCVTVSSWGKKIWLKGGRKVLASDTRIDLMPSIQPMLNIVVMLLSLRNVTKYLITCKTYLS